MDAAVRRPLIGKIIGLLYLLAWPLLVSAQFSGAEYPQTLTAPLFQPAHSIVSYGAITRGDTTRQALALIFTGGDFSDGGETVRSVLQQTSVAAGFFFTGDFYRNAENADLIRGLVADGHYLGPHSNRHLLYCDWSRRDSLLVTREIFFSDLHANYAVMDSFGIKRKTARFFIPPYEWYNQTIADWTAEAGVVLINFTPGTRSNADYTTPDMHNYLSSAEILAAIDNYEQKSSCGLNGFILLLHIGTAPQRTDKLTSHLGELIHNLRQRGYRFERIDHLLQP